MTQDHWHCFPCGTYVVVGTVHYCPSRPIADERVPITTAAQHVHVPFHGRPNEAIHFPDHLSPKE